MRWYFDEPERKEYLDWCQALPLQELEQEEEEQLGRMRLTVEALMNEIDRLDPAFRGPVESAFQKMLPEIEKRFMIQIIANWRNAERVLKEIQAGT